MKFEWECVWEKNEYFDYEEIARAKIFGGWLVTYRVDSKCTMVFVPDPNHEWEIDK